MPRPSNTQQRREEIVHALLSVMADKGYASATIQAIAKQAGLKPGLIHYHFKTKQAILVELVKWVSDRAQQRYEALASDAHTPQEKLSAFIDAHLAKGSDAQPEAVAAWVVIGTEAIRQAEVKALYEETIVARQQTLVSLLIASSQPPLTIDKATQLASLAIATMEGAFQLSVATQAVMPEGYAAPGLLQLLQHALAPTHRE